MHRVTQYEIYMLGRIQSLGDLQVGKPLAPFRRQLILSYLTLDGFCKNEMNSSLLPRSSAEARLLLPQIGILEVEASGGGMSSDGILNQGSQDMLSKLLIAFETTLRQELRELPTYVLERHGIYNADDLVSRADDCFSQDIKSRLPDIVTRDIKQAGACLVFDLFTACGFHAFRALDAMLRTYFGHFAPGITPPKSRDWGSFIRELRKLLANPIGGKSPNERTVELLDKIRSEDRNPLIHPDQNLDKEEATASFDLCRNVITFMTIDIKNPQ